MKSRLLKKLLAGFMALTLSFSSMGISSFAYEGERSTEAEDESSDAVLSEEENASEDEELQPEGYVDDTFGQESDELLAENEDDDISEDSAADEGSFSDVTKEDLEESEKSGDNSAKETEKDLPEKSEQEQAGETKIESSSDYSIEFPEGFEGMVDDHPACVDEDGYSVEESSLYGNSSEDVEVDITGTYYTLPAETILDQLNKIRKEAFELGYTDAYVPLKWSSVIESAARKRAMEAALTVAHQRLNGGSIYEYMQYPYLFRTVAENLAWNNNHNSSGITYGIKQFYDEKSAYEAYLKDGQDHGVTGHYTSIINPKYTYVGVGGCQMEGAPYGWFTVALQLGGYEATSVDETKDTTTGSVTNRLRVSSDCISSASISGPDSIIVGSSASYSLQGKLSVANSYGGSKATFKVPAGDESGIEWSSSNPGAATISNGVAVGEGGGSTVISAVSGNISAEKTISVIVPLDRIEFTCAALSDMTLNDSTIEVERDSLPERSGQVQVGYLPDNTTDPKSVTWKSSNTKVATIDSEGKFKLLKAGTVVFTATAKSSYPDNPIITQSFTLDVKVPLTGINLNKESAALNYTTSKAPTLQLIATPVPSDAQDDYSMVYSSSNPEVATVNEEGLVTAVAGGTCVITAQAKGFTDSCEVKVVAPAKSLDTDVSEVKIFTTDSSAKVTVTVTPSYTSDKEIVFSSSDTGVFTVSDGKTTGREVVVTANNGVAAVTVNRAASTNATATLNVRIKTEGDTKPEKDIPVIIAKPATGIKVYEAGGTEDLSGKELEAEVGSVVKYVCEVEPRDAYDKSIVWQSLDESIATVTATSENTATVTYLRKGKVAIVCRNENALSPITTEFTARSDIYATGVSLSRTCVNSMREMVILLQHSFYQKVQPEQ